MEDVETSRQASSKKIQSDYKILGSGKTSREKDTSKMHTLHFDVSFSVMQNKQPKILLDNVSDVVQRFVLFCSYYLRISP